MPHDLNDLYYFAKVVECGGFAAAGRETGIPKSRLSRRIAELEERLQVRLLHRTTRKLALTEVGERYLQHCRNLLLEAEMAEQVIAELSVEPRGRLRLSAPVAMASSNLADLLPRFLERHPQVQLEILLTNRRVDLLNEGVDVALRVRELGDEDPALVCRRLAPATTQILAAPSLIAGRRLEHPEDLEDLPFLGAIHNDRKVHATLIGPDGSRYQLEREPRLGVDDFVLRKKAAVAGLGVTLLPEGYCDRELADGSLVRILPQWTLPKSTMQAAYLPRSSQIPAIRALIDFLVEALQRPSGETCLSVQVHPPGASGRQHAEDQQDQQLRQRALQRARRSRRRPRLGPRHRRLGATADSRRIDGQRVQPRPLGAQAALGILAGEKPHLVALAGTAVAAERGDMQEDFFPAGLRQDEAEALVVIPAADHARLFHIHIHSLATRFALHSSHPRRPDEKRRGSRRASCLFPGLTPRRRCSSRSGGIARSPGSAGRRRSDTRRKPRSCGCR